MNQKDRYKLRITEPCVVIEPGGGDRLSAKEGDIVTVDGDSAHNILAGGKGVLVEGELPNALKGTPGRSARA